jgi:hypothetical protein
MFEICNQPYPVCTESVDEAYDNNNAGNISLAAPLVTDGTDQKIFLPPGSGQSRFAPPSYYYLASKSGVMPSWVIDQLHRAQDLNLNS